MKMKSTDKKYLQAKIFSLMDEVERILESGTSVDDFIDETNIFDDWEHMIPEREYPIFVMAVLNNIRKESIIETILFSILNDTNKKNMQKTSYPKKSNLISHFGELPFN